MPLHEDDSDEDDDDDGDNDEVDYEDVEERFFMTTSDEDRVLEEFKNWLVGIEGGRKPERTAQQHKNVVASVLHFKEDLGSFKNLTDKDILEAWMQSSTERNLKPGTIRTNTYSILAFYDFCEIKNDHLKTIDMHKMRVIIKKWNKNLKKAIEETSHESSLRNLNDLPTPEAIDHFDKSTIVGHAKHLFRNVKLVDSNRLQRKDFCAMRDYLISTIILDNASRCGAVANMTLEEWEKKIRSGDDGFLIAVKKHKTGYKGPALLSISHSISRKLEKYVLLRNELPGVGVSPKDAVFVSWAGKKMATGMVLGQFCSFWRQAVPTEFHRITTTLVRMCATTTVRGNMPEYKVQTANLLCHSDKTAEKSYNLIDRTKKAAETSRIIKRAMRTNFVSTKKDSIVEEMKEKGEGEEEKERK